MVTKSAENIPYIAKKYDSSGLYYVSPTSAAHRLKCTPKRGNLVFGKFYYKERFSCFVAGNLVNKQCTQENQNDTDRIHCKAYPACIVKERTGKQSNYGNFSTARHERSQHCSSSALTLIADGTACHNTWNGTSDTNNERNNGLTGKTDLLEDRIENDRNTGHIATIFKQSKQEVHYHYEGQEAYYRYYTADYAVNENSRKEG